MTPHKCPTCLGTGLVSRPPNVAGDVQTWSSTGTGPHPCRCCYGTGIIWSEPQFIFECDRFVREGWPEVFGADLDPMDDNYDPDRGPMSDFHDRAESPWTIPVSITVRRL